MWGLISGVEKTSPRTELPLVMDHPTSHNAALIVGDYKLLLGTIGLAYLFSATPLSNAHVCPLCIKTCCCVHTSDVWNRYWQGNAFPNGTDCAHGTPDNECDAPYKGSFLSADCGDIVSLEGGCLYNIRKDAHVSLLICTQARSYNPNILRYAK